MHVNPKSCLMEMSHLVKMTCLANFHVSSSGNSMTRLVKIFYFHDKLWHVTCKTFHVATHVRACRNEVIVELYHSNMCINYLRTFVCS